MTALRTLAVLCSFATSSLIASVADAKPSFPGQIESYLNLSYVPPCSLCHIDGVTGGQTVVTPFGYSIVKHGLSGGKSGMNTALDAMKASGVDSDGDGVTDIDELIRGTDPSSAANGELSGPKSSSGCAASGGGSTAPGALAAGVAALALLLSRRRR